MDLIPLYQATADGELKQALDAQPELVSEEAAEQAHADFIGASEAGRADIAYLAATTGAIIRLQLGQREEALSERFGAAQALFLLAEDVPAYDNARAEAQEIGAHAVEIGALGLVFRCWVQVADCSWFAFDADPDDPRPRLMQSMRDCADALDWAGRLPDLEEQDNWLERLASLVSVVSGEAMSRVWSEDLLEADAVMRRLARGTEALPVDMAFESTGGVAKTAQVASLLSELESRYGAP